LLSFVRLLSLFRLLCFSPLSLPPPSLSAQVDSTRRADRIASPFTLASALLDPITLPTSLDKDVEKMLEQWYTGYGNATGKSTGSRYGSVSVPYTPDSVYVRMLNKMPSAMRFSYNPLVREAIELYLFKRRGLLSSMLSLGDLYFPEIEMALDKNGLPMELRYLVIVESALNPKAISPAGAAGLWQLMLPTGKIYGLTPEEVTPDMRRRAKTANFGIIYGISAFGLSERLSIPRKEAKELIDGYFASYPGVANYMSRVVEEAKHRGYVTTLLDRRRSLPDINSANAVVRGYAERNAINAPLQGSAADLIKIAMIRLDPPHPERFMRTPQENPTGYKSSSALEVAKKLKGKLLLIHGSADDNVHVQNAMNFTDLLVAEGIPFDMAIYKDRNHGIYGGNARNHLYKRIITFLEQNL